MQGVANEVIRACGVGTMDSPWASFLCRLPMWTRLATIILRRRLPILLVLAAITAGMAMRIDELGIRYKFGGLLPEDDPSLEAYESFLEQFGE
jgi:uncharacterized membrane protein YdfJ with MMPL/SSD domain